MENRKVEDFIICFYKIFNIIFKIIGIIVFFFPVIHRVKLNEIDWLTIIIAFIEVTIVLIYEYGFIKEKEGLLNEKLENSKKDKQIYQLKNENNILKEKIKEEIKI